MWAPSANDLLGKPLDAVGPELYYVRRATTSKQPNARAVYHKNQRFAGPSLRNQLVVIFQGILCDGICQGQGSVSNRNLVLGELGTYERRQPSNA